jgi:hypothetical protein
VFRASSGVSPWERHPTGDELLHVLEGEVEIVVQAEVGPVRTKVSAGSVFVVPRGLWHRHDVRERLVELYVTPGATEHSTADDPRKAKRRPRRVPNLRLQRPAMLAALKSGRVAAQSAAAAELTRSAHCAWQQSVVADSSSPTCQNSASRADDQHTMRLRLVWS